MIKVYIYIYIYYQGYIHYSNRGYTQKTTPGSEKSWHHKGQCEFWKNIPEY